MTTTLPPTPTLTTAPATTTSTTTTTRAARLGRLLRGATAATGAALIAAALTPLGSAPAIADGDPPPPIASFDFDDAPTDGRFTSGAAVATVQGTAELVPGKDGQGTAAALGEEFWLDVTAADGGSLLQGHDQLTISYDSRPATSGNVGWTVYAAASDAPPTGGEERYIGILDTASGLTVERYHNSGVRDTTGNLSTSGLAAEWRHVDVVLDGTTAKLYIDQQLVDVATEGPTPDEVLGDDGILQLGKANWGSGEYFTGLLDNLTIYPAALTSVQLGLPAPETVVITGSAVVGEGAQVWQGEHAELTATVGPDGAEGSVTWSSADPEIATVDGGNVTGLMPGITTITATADADPSVSAEITVTVLEITDESTVERDAAALAIENAEDMRHNFSLPTVGPHGATISWRILAGAEHASLEDGVNDSSLTARVQRPASADDAAEIRLEATISAGQSTATREFTVTVQPMPAGSGEDEAYIWAFFTGEGVGGEKISLAASRGNDALDWNTLNDGEPLFTSEHGEEGLRDPFILRSPDGDTFYLIATDLKIDGRASGFTGAQMNGSLAVEVWESTDLINWSEQRHVEVSSEYAGNTWAPEAYWDETRETFVMYWASNLYETQDPGDRTTPNYNRMMYATTDDFITFSEPQVWIDVDRRGQAGAGSIDVTVTEHEGDYYRIYKDEKSMTLRQERSTDLLATVEGSYPGTTGADDEWVELGTDLGAGQPNGYGGTFTQSEGPSLFPANEGDENGYEYYLFADQPNYHGGPNHYVPMATDDITDASSWEVIGEQMPQDRFPQNVDGGMPRHGTIVPVTREQYQGVLEAYAPQLAVRSVAAMNVTTTVGTAPTLPETAELEKADGSVEDAAVEWDEVPSESYAAAGTFLVAGVAQDDSRQPVEVLVTVGDGTDEGDLAIDATTRCVAGRTVLVTTVSHTGAEQVTATVSTPYGDREITVGAESRTSHSFSTRRAALPSGEVTIESGGVVTTATFPATSCG
ncbi:MAG TPA: Ig-like domain-containing protein [Candidatus Brachybacterium merdigallinarum]|nr:Ig-like domain-containing protein [Candidatus Brachybacterium merdigallinarum]